jgi:hypothetical protein
MQIDRKSLKYLEAKLLKEWVPYEERKTK